MATDDEIEQPTIEDRPVSDTQARPRLTGDRYRVGDPIGRGGMGEVLAARDEQIGREVAIKRMRAREPDDRQIARFLREARIQGRLDHPAIVPVHELGRDRDGRPFFAMKKLAGTTLSAILARGDANLKSLLRAFADVCLAVEFAHVHGVIHRDLKPSNIVLGEFGEVYVLDWGIAKVAGEANELDDLRSDAATTLVGAQIGTPAYISPEQAHDGSDVDARTDVFSLGRVLGDILEHGDAPPELEALRALATAEDRDARLASPRELGAAVMRYLDGDRDLALRHQLAREHLERARVAFAGGDSVDQRRLAMREAASAMALDPKLEGASELVSRLMLEPPRELPPDVERAIASDDHEFARAQGWARLTMSLFGLLFAVPYLVVTGVRVGAAVFGAGVAISLGTNVARLRRSSVSATPVWVVAAINVPLVALSALLFSPVLIAPAVAAITVVSLAASRYLERPISVALLALAFFAAIVLPAVGEQLGVLPRTMEVVPQGLLLEPPSRIQAELVVPMVALYAFAVISAALVLGRLMRAQERRSRRQLHLQAWQLRQLVA